MKGKVLVAGASGALGLEIMKLLQEKGISARALIHSPESGAQVAPFTSDIFQADASEGIKELEGVTEGIDLVISAMGKSVSLFTNDESSFMENDFQGNCNLLEQAKRDETKRFIYISIKGADTGQEFEVAKAHKKFEERLQNSGIDHTIIRPVGFFSGLNDLAIIAKRKLIPIVGEGEAKTNSIHQKDLAGVVLEYLEEGPNLIEVGGPLVHTRMEMAEMLKEKIGGKIVQVPEKVAEWGMIVPELFHDSMASKLKYFKFITTNDMIGEKKGKITFKHYLDNLDLKDLP